MTTLREVSSKIEQMALDSVSGDDATYLDSTVFNITVIEEEIAKLLSTPMTPDSELKKAEAEIERLHAELARVEGERDAYKNAPVVSVDVELGMKLILAAAELTEAKLQNEALRSRLPTPEMVRKAAVALVDGGYHWDCSGFAANGSPHGTLSAIIAAALGVDMSGAAPTPQAPAVPEAAIRAAAEEIFQEAADARDADGNFSPHEWNPEVVADIIRRHLGLKGEGE